MATAAGMFSSTLLTLIVVPVFYLVIDDATEWIRQRWRSRRGAGMRAEPTLS